MNDKMKRNDKVQENFLFMLDVKWLLRRFIMWFRWAKLKWTTVGRLFESFVEYISTSDICTHHERAHPTNLTKKCIFKIRTPNIRQTWWGRAFSFHFCFFWRHAVLFFFLYRYYSFRFSCSRWLIRIHTHECIMMIPQKTQNEKIIIIEK